MKNKRFTASLCRLSRAKVLGERILTEIERRGPWCPFQRPHWESKGLYVRSELFDIKTLDNKRQARARSVTDKEAVRQPGLYRERVKSWRKAHKQ